MAFYNLSRRKMRTSLTLLGIIIGIGSVVAMISLGNGMESAISDALQSFGPNKIYIIPGSSESGMSGMGSAFMGEPLTEKDLERIKDVNGVRYAFPILMKMLPVEYDGTTRTIYVMGISPDDAEIFFSDVQSYELSKGRIISEGDKYSIIGGSLVETDVFPEDVKLKSKLTIKNVDFRVIGFLKNVGNPEDDSTVYMSLDTLREISGEEDTITAIMAEADENPTQVAQKIEDELADLHGEEDLFMAMTTEQLQKQMQQIFGIMSIVLGGIAGISLLVAGFGIMNTMLMSVLERTREIGIMKALGATNRRVMTIFLIETAVIGFIGGVAGIIFGSVIYLGISYAATNFWGFALSMTIQPSLIIMALLFSIGVGVASGLYPAWRASKLNPVEALRYE